MMIKHTRKKVGFNKKAIFYIDKMIKRSFLFQLLCLSFIVVAVVTAGGILATLATPQKTLFDNLWWAFLRVTDPGYLGEDSALILGVIGTLVIVAGLIVFGLLITIISNGFQARLESLKKGRIQVIERGHSLILGWGGVIYSVIDELLLADKICGNKRDPKPIVILSDISREEMESKIAKHCKAINGGEIITRTGDIRSVPDLEMVNLQDADEIVILIETGSEERRIEDAKITQTLFAVIKTFNRANADALAQAKRQPSENDYKLKIVFWVYEKDTIGILSHLGKINPHMFIHMVTPNDFIPRLIAQSSIEPGFEKLYGEFVSFDGQSFYSKKLRDLGVNKQVSFGELIHGFSGALPIGYKKAGSDDLFLNPNRDQQHLSLDDNLIYIAPKPDQIFSEAIKPGSSKYIVSNAPVQTSQPKKAVIIGEGEKVANIIRNTQHYLPEGSTILHTVEELQNEEAADGRINIRYIPDDDSMHSHIMILNKELPCDIIILADTNSDIDSHDSEILLKITGIKNEEIKRGIPQEKCALIVAEFLDPQNAELISVLEEDKGCEINKIEILSTEYISKFLVQTIKNPDNATVFSELLDPRGQEIGTRPLSFFIDLSGTSQEIPFRDVMSAAYERGYIAIGYFEKDTKGKRLPHKINPAKDALLNKDTDVICIADFFD